MALIRANRESIDDRFSVLGFTVRTENPLFEIGLATDPELLKAENRTRRNAANFFSSSLLGTNARRGEAARGESVYLVPPNVVARFVGQARLYFGLATYREGNRSHPVSVKTPDRGNMYVNLSGLTERGLRRTARLNGAASYGNGNGQDLTWGGDALAAGSPSKSNGNGAANTAAPNGEPASYSDGYSEDLWQPNTGASASAPVNGNGSASINDNATTTAPAATQAWRTRGLSADGLSTEEQGDESRGIEGPIPDHNPADDPTFSTPQGLRGLARPLSAPSPEYPQAARFAPAHASNFRATTSPRTIERIVIHITDGGANINGTISWFQNPAAGVSAHYVIGQDGEIVQMVRHNDVAWHARSANGTGIGIEHVANTRGLNPTPAQMCASAALVMWLCDQYGIAADRTHILGHSEADTATTHTGCPNAVWDWAYYMEMITTRTCFEPTSTTANTLGYSALGGRGAQRFPARQLQHSYAPTARQSQTYAKPLLVEPYNQPSSWWDALTTQLGHFARGAMWFLGVTDTTQPPYSAICQVRRPDGSAEGAHVGTAFFIGPRLLLTAGHVVDGESELIIVPGKNGGGTGSATEPFGRFHVTQFRKHGAYGTNGHDNDMALICVPAANAASAPNYFGLVEELTQSRPEGVVVSGYAAWWHATSDIEIFVNNNIDQNRQHAHGGYIRELPTDGTFTYDLQTLAGTSGSPVYWIEGDTQPCAHLVGVHVAANDDRTNRGCRITQEKLRWIRETAATWGQTLTFSLGAARSLSDAENSAVEDDPDQYSCSPEPVDEATAGAQAYARSRALDTPTSDYPQASRFAPAHTNNYRVGRRRDRIVDRIVVHITAGGPSINGTIGWFQNGDRPNSSSSHYIVGRDGEVVQMVRNADTAYHASSANSRSIGIEHNANKPYKLNRRDLPLTEPQYEASARLVAWLCQQYNLPIDREHIIGHAEASPGDNHDCPSSIWDWDHYMACVQIAANATTSSTPTAQSLGSRAYARAQDIITPFYDPADPSSALTCQADAFSLAREEWFSGVPNTTIFPHSAICLLEMKDASGNVASRGTGFYIGANRILTCGHNLYNASYASVDVIPGNNGQGNEPFGRFNVARGSWRIPNSYGGSNPAYDLAVIDNVPVAAPNGWWFPVLEELNQSRPEGVVVCGYSSRSPRVPELTAAIDGFKQHLHAGYIAALGAGDSTFDYPILTLKRASGSPVYYISDKDGSLKAYIVGVHTGSATDDLNRGVRLTTAKIDWIEGRTTTLGYNAPSHSGNAVQAGARSLATDPVDLPVALIPQPDKNACWAAAMAMLLSWRRNASFAPETLANEVGASLASSYGWDLLNAVRDRYGFTMIPQPSNTSLYHKPQQWSEWLNTFGALWVVIVGAPHAVVVAGIRGNLNDPASVQVKLLNPWDTRVSFDGNAVEFHPVNNGYEDWISFQKFAADFGNMSEPDYGNWRVLHLPVSAAPMQSLSAGQSLSARGGLRLARPPAPVRAFDASSDFIGTQAETREPIEPSRIAGTRMSVLRGSAGANRWALDQLEGLKSPATLNPTVSSAAPSDVTIELGEWPAVEGQSAPLPLTITFRATQGSVGDVQIHAGTPANLAYGVEVIARIDDEADVGNVAALRIGIDYRFTGLAQGGPTARIELRLLGDGRYERENRWLTTDMQAAA